MKSDTATSAKVKRLLAIVPWVVEHPGVSVSQIAERFDMRPETVFGLLSAAMCYEVRGAGGFENLGVVLYGDSDRPGEAWVHVEPGALLDRPLNLSAPQAWGILVAGKAALALRGADTSGALTSALDKLAEAYGERVRVSVQVPRPASLGLLQEAMANGTTVSIEYYTPNTDGVTQRRVDPLDVSLQDGHWYLRGWCHLREAVRSFRADRIESCTDTGEQHGRPAEGGWVTPAEADGWTRVVVSIPRGDLRRVESFPSVEVAEEAGGASGDGAGGEGRCLATYTMRNRAVLAQLLLRLGPDSYVVNVDELPEEFAEAGPDAAAAILELYES